MIVFAIDLADGSISATPQALSIGLVITALLLVLLSLIIRAKNKQ